MPLVIKTRVPFQPWFVPPVLLKRDEEFDEIFNALTSPVAKNLYIYGQKGVGKSITVLRVIDEIAARYPDDFCPFYIQLQSSLNTTWKLSFRNIPVRERGASYILKTAGQKRGIVVFDDVQNLYRCSDLVHVLKDLYDGSRGNIAIALISTQSLYSFERSHLFGGIGEGVGSRYMFHPVSFRPYARDEIAAILEQRLELATGGAGGWEQDAINFMASKVERHGSDMRLGMRLLINSVELAVGASSNLTLEVAQEAWRREKEDYWVREYLELRPHEAFLLYQTFLCMMKRGGEVLSRDIYDAYVKTCASMNIKPMVGRQLFNYLQDLGHKGFLKLTVEFTPQGKLTRVTSDLQPEMMVSAGNRIEWKNILK